MWLLIFQLKKGEIKNIYIANKWKNSCMASKLTLLNYRIKFTIFVKKIKLRLL